MSLLTATYILVTALTLFSIKRQGDLMQRQGELMEKQIEAMNDTAIRQLRAYVCLSSAIIKFTRPDAPEVTIQMKNCGQTPALEVRQWIHMWIEDWPLKVNLPEPPPDFQMSTAVLPPGGTHIMSRTKIPPVSSEEIKLLGTAQGTIYIYGKVLYKDVFGKERYTQYRLMHGGRERGETWSDKGVLCGMMSPDIGGNEGS